MFKTNLNYLSLSLSNPASSVACSLSRSCSRSRVKIRPDPTRREVSGRNEISSFFMLGITLEIAWGPFPAAVPVPWHPVRKLRRCGLSTMPVSCWSALIRSFGSRRGWNSLFTFKKLSGNIKKYCLVVCQIDAYQTLTNYGYHDKNRWDSKTFW